jgi:hypothetical protein
MMERESESGRVTEEGTKTEEAGRERLLSVLLMAANKHVVLAITGAHKRYRPVGETMT